MDNLWESSLPSSGWTPVFLLAQWCSALLASSGKFSWQDALLPRHPLIPERVVHFPMVFAATVELEIPVPWRLWYSGNCTLAHIGLSLEFYNELLSGYYFCFSMQPRIRLAVWLPENRVFLACHLSVDIYLLLGRSCSLAFVQVVRVISAPPDPVFSSSLNKYAPNEISDDPPTWASRTYVCIVKCERVWVLFSAKDK